MIDRTGQADVKRPHSAHALTRALSAFQCNNEICTGTLSTVAGHRPRIVEMLIGRHGARLYHLFTGSILQHHLAVLPQRLHPVLFMRRVAGRFLRFVHAHAVSHPQFNMLALKNLNFRHVQLGGGVKLRPATFVAQDDPVYPRINRRHDEIAVVDLYHLTGIPGRRAVEVMTPARDARQHRHRDGLFTQLLQFSQPVMNALVNGTTVFVQLRDDERLFPCSGRAASPVRHDSLHGRLGFDNRPGGQNHFFRTRDRRRRHLHDFFNGRGRLVLDRAVYRRFQVFITLPDNLFHHGHVDGAALLHQPERRTAFWRSKLCDVPDRDCPAPA
ncbi:hypothetical protein NB703_003908 [Pantoea ananatis]|uniref:Uncharacterized protein n=1 Tax=Pantoea ananas TaxID=553 RepID=A0AAJ1D1Z7_PANAN|nr:hypothetical protein [Pantoea ananatis]